VRAAARAAVPLAVLGAGRAISVKATAYAEHVSEYGVHWNYFFTLAAVSMATAVVVAAGVMPRAMAAVGVVVLIGV
jgi:phosphatidylinositol glycan class W